MTIRRLEKAFMATTIAVHGNAVSFAEAPGACEQVEGIAWTDVVGLRRGWGATFRGRGGRLIWFHYSIPALSLINDATHNLASLELFFDIEGRASVQHVHVWNNNRHRIFAHDDLRATADVTIETGSLRLDSDASVSIGVFFQETASITFRGVNAHLTPTEPSPPPIEVVFAGTAVLRTTHDRAHGPFTQPISFNMYSVVIAVRSRVSLSRR